MKVKSSELVGLYKALGYNGADTWDEAKLSSRLSKIESVARETEGLEAHHDELLNDILGAQEAGEPVEIEMDTTPATKKPKKEKPAKEKPAKEKPAKEKPAGKKDNKKTVGKPAAGKKSTEKPAGKKTAGKTFPSVNGRTGVGIIATMLERLKQASKKKPATRKDVLVVLKKKFPEREERAMAVTVASQLPTRLRRRKDVDLKDDGKGGYWIES